jgi:hypothetical protein
MESTENDFTVCITTTTEVIEKVIKNCLYLQKDLGEVLEGTKGRVLKDIPGKLYVGGLFVCDINGAKYSYDFHPQYLPLNRDRKSVNGWDLANNTSALLEEVMPSKDVAELVFKRSVDTGGYWTNPKSQAVANAVYEALKERHGEDVVFCDEYSEKDKLEKRGFKNVAIIGTHEYRTVKLSEEYEAAFERIEAEENIKEEDTRSPLQILEDWYNDLDSTDYDFEVILELFKDRGVTFDS